MTTYTNLIADIQQWHEDDSAEFVAALPDIVARAEDRIFLNVPNISSFRTSETGTFTASTKTFTSTATDIRQVRYLYYVVSGVNTFLEPRSEDFVEDYAATAATAAAPKFYAIQSAASAGTTFILGPTPDSNYAYTLKYTRIPTRLSASNANTFIGDNYPSLMQSATMFEAAIFLQKEADLLAGFAADYEKHAGALANEIRQGNLEQDGA